MKKLRRVTQSQAVIEAYHRGYAAGRDELLREIRMLLRLDDVYAHREDT